MHLCIIIERSKPIDYALRVADIEPFYYLLAAGIAVLVWISLGKWRTGLLVPPVEDCGSCGGVFHAD